MILVDLNKRLENLIQTDSDFCFCWSWKLYKDCCKDKDKPNWVNDDIIKSIDKYDKKPDFTIFNDFQREFWFWSQCIVSWCDNDAIDSHIISLHKLKETSEWDFLFNPSLRKNGIIYKRTWKKSISEKIWCNRHDTKFFNEIDNYYFDFDRDESQIEKFTWEYVYRVLWHAKRQLDSFVKYTYLLQLTQKDKLIKTIRPDWEIKNYPEYNLINKVYKKLENEILLWIYDTRNIYVLKVESSEWWLVNSFYYDSSNWVVIILEAERSAQYLYIISYDEFVNERFRTKMSELYNKKELTLDSLANLINWWYKDEWINSMKINMKTWKSSCFLYA